MPSPQPALIERYRDRLPVTASTPIVTLGEGSTPLIAAPRISARLGVEVWLKLEGLNPTGSFKDRGMTLAISKAVEDGARRVICASTGNTSASAAAYAARAGLGCVVVMPAGHVARGKIAQAQIAGASICAVDGSFDDALRIVRELASNHPITLVNNLNPYRLEGQKTAAFEIIDEFGVPDWLVLPVGNGGNITAYWQGFCEAVSGGWASDRPALLGCQAQGAATMVEGRDIEAPETIATAIRIGAPVRRREAAAAARASEGGFVAVSDDDIVEWYRRLAVDEGVFCEPSSAASLAGLAQARADGRVADQSRVACILTGHGLKDPDAVATTAASPVVISATPDALAEAVLG
jgi:threonine synthase